MSLPNWDGSENPFNLQPPPDDFLFRLAAFDAELVILPGIAAPVYRLCRRSGVMALAKSNVPGGETARCIRLRVVPVVSLKSSVTWNDDIMQWLTDRDSWAIREDPADRLEALEQAAADKQQAEQDDEADQRSTSAWFALKVRRGSTAFIHRPDSQQSGELSPGAGPSP